MRAGGVLVVAVALSLAPARLLAQGAGGTPQGPPPPPQPAVPDGSRITPYRQTFRMVMSRNGEEQQVGSLTDEVTVSSAGGAPVVVRVQQIQAAGRGTMVDTAVAAGASLAPRWHSSHGPNRVLRVEFSPGRVRGTEQPRGGEAQPIDHTVGNRIYDSNMLDVLVAALPLHATYRGRLSVYLYEAGGETPVDVGVMGSETVGGVETWVVGVMLGGRMAKYYVARNTPRVMQIVSSPAPGMELRFAP